MTDALTEIAGYHRPHAFVDRRAEPVLIRTLSDKHVERLLDMYLAYEPRGSFNGLPPIEDGACVMWVKHMVDTGVNLVALSFDAGVVGHAVLFPMREGAYEFLVVISPSHQGAGIGTELTRDVMQLGYEAGIDRIWLCVEEMNRVARHVYRKCGFRDLGSADSGEVAMQFDITRYRELMQHPITVVMRRKAVTVESGITCLEAIQLCLERHLSALPVVESDGRVSGILTATDLLRAGGAEQKVSDVLTHNVVTIDSQCDVARAARLLQSQRLRCLPVVDGNGRFLGIVGRREILAHLIRTSWREEMPHDADASGRDAVVQPASV
ncbi:MAG: GNAT family N-acetyltransferase [Kiritimatiellae bacterium]|nr:GNAT family N-acetyltransferase [Kiritimatiellia bacterium]